MPSTFPFRRPVFLLLTCLALAACGAPPARTGGAAGSVARPAVMAPDFGDADPHPEVAAAARYAVHGMDVSRFQTGIDWHRARQAGVNFVFIKATEGGDHLDPMFTSHWRGAGAAGIRRGAYHFFYHCRPAREQARWFIAHVPASPGSLPPVLDMEWTPFSPTCTLRREPGVLRAEAEVFMSILERHYGQRPILYTSIDFFEDNEMWRLQGTEFWLRSVAAHPHDLYDGQHWRFWQYTSTGLVPGVPGKADINVFSGGAGAWADWLARRSVN